MRIDDLPYYITSGDHSPSFALPMTHNFAFDSSRNQSGYVSLNKVYFLESRPSLAWMDLNITNSTGLYMHLSFVYHTAT